MNKNLIIIGIVLMFFTVGSAYYMTGLNITQTSLGTFQKSQYDTIGVDAVFHYKVASDIPVSPKCELIVVNYPDGNIWIAREAGFSSPLYVGDIRSTSWSYTFRDSDTYTHPTGRYYVKAGIYENCDENKPIGTVIDGYFDVIPYSTKPICTAPEGKCAGNIAYNCAGGVWATSGCTYDCSVTNNVASCETKPIICGDGSCHPDEQDICPLDCKPTVKVGSKKCLDNWVSTYTQNTMNAYSWIKVLDCKTGVCEDNILTQPSCDMELATCYADKDCIYPSYKCLYEDETSTNKVCKQEICTIERDCDDGDWLTLDKCGGTEIIGVDTGLNKKCTNTDMTNALLIGIVVAFLSLLVVVLSIKK